MNKSFGIIGLILFSSLANASYEDHFPAYYEYCTGTQWKLQSGEEGGKPGHGFTYIHGLCKDYRSSYPQVIPCSEVSEDLKAKYPHEGVGVSLDKNFSNVMWVAVPGRDLTFFGDITGPRAITHDDVKTIIQKTIDLKIFNDVVHKGKKAQELPLNSQEYLEEVADATLGTEYAVTWARELHCARIPIQASSLPAVARFLNEANNQYKQGPGYEWDKISNNCAHLAINSSKQMGINDSILVDQAGVKKYFNMALPSNTFLMYADLSALSKKPSLKKLSKVINQKGYTPVQIGSLINNYPAYPSGDKFNTGHLSILTAPRPKQPLRFLSTPEKYEAKYMTPKNTQLIANAKSWQGHYQKLLGQLKPQKVPSKIEIYLKDQLQLIDSIINY
jgi:hypothetical protein